MDVKVILVIYGFFISGTFALHCYSCLGGIKYPSHVPHDECLARQFPSHLTNITCPSLTKEEVSMGALPVCYKIEKSSFEFENETFIYERGCATKYGPKDFCHEHRLINPEDRCYLCYYDNCNDANDMQIIRCLMFFLAIVVVLYMRDQAERNHLRDSRQLRW